MAKGNIPKFFIFEDGLLRINREEVLLHRPFKLILRRDRGTDGDAQGRNKQRAMQELGYVYLMCDYESYCNKHGMNENEAHKYAMQAMELPLNWTPDEIVNSAMLLYKQMQLDPAQEYLIEIIKTFRVFVTKVSTIRENLDKISTASNLNEKQIDDVYAQMKRLFELATEAPVQINRLLSTLELIRKADSMAEEVRGGGDVSSSMEPETSLGG